MSRWKTFGLLIAIAGLLGGPMEIQAQEPPEERENYALITHTNGMTWKQEIFLYHIQFLERHKPQVAEIVVPENALINLIFAEGCVNLTNIVIHPKTAPPLASWAGSGQLSINVGENSELRNITCYGEMRDRIIIYGGATFHAGGWSIIPPVQWTELFPWGEPEPPRIEIKTHATGNGKEMKWKLSGETARFKLPMPSMENGEIILESVHCVSRLPPTRQSFSA